MTSTRASTSHTWEPLLARASAKQEENFREDTTSPCVSSNCSGSLTGSPPLCSGQRLEKSPSRQLERDAHTVGASCLLDPNVDSRAGLRRPELTFSIERILGLTCSSHTARAPPMVGATMPDRRVFTAVVASNIGAAGGRGVVRHHGRAQDNNDDDDVDEDDVDEEDDDDDGDDSESIIDVGGPGESAHFLSRAAHDFPGELSCMNQDGVPNYQWLHCTRYHPPKLQRSKKASGGKKRKLGRNPRVPFTQHQVMVLEEKFRRTHYLSSMDVAELSTALSLTETRVKIWFQNRRARERRDKEAQQRSQHAGVSPKPFQPLTIPTVTWSVPSQPMTSSNFGQFAGHHASHQDLSTSGYLSSAFSMFAGPVAAVRKASATVDIADFNREPPRNVLFIDSASRGRLSAAEGSSEDST